VVEQHAAATRAAVERDHHARLRRVDGSPGSSVLPVCAWLSAQHSERDAHGRASPAPEPVVRTWPPT
jgi:hypothetical protein